MIFSPLRTREPGMVVLSFSQTLIHDLRNRFARKDRSMRAKLLAPFGALILIGWAAAPAFAVLACTAADIRTAEGTGCPVSQEFPCTISKSFEVTMNGCVFDFGTQAVTILGGGARRIDAGGYQGIVFRAGSITMNSLSEIRGKGGGGGANGASITIETSGNFTMLEGSSKLDVAVSGDNVAGDLLLDIGGGANIEGQVLAEAVSSFGIGGTISIFVVGNLTSTGVIKATNPQASFSPGAIEIETGGTMTIGSVDVSGGDGGEIFILSGLNLVVNGVLDADGTGDAGSGGSIDITSFRGATFNAELQARGTGGTFQTGGSGGTITVLAEYGDIAVNNHIRANGAGPDGDADEVSLVALGSIVVAGSRIVSARTDAGLGVGGVLALEAEVDVIANGTLDASGGLEGGELLVGAGRNVTIGATVDARGRNAGAFGGSLFVDAGLRVRGTLQVNGTVDSGGGICSAEEGCGVGGLQNLVGCSVTLGTGTSLQNRGADGGEIFVQARGLMTVVSTAVINATTNVGFTNGSNGFVGFEHSQTVLPSISGSANVQPPADVVAITALPCPACGNGVLDAPEETCDDGNQNGCDGCSFACEIEDGDDGNPCTNDTCVNLLGWLNEAVVTGTPCCDGFGIPRNCSGEDDVCNIGVCNPATEVCEPQPANEDGPCDDGLHCSSGQDTCNNGFCGYAGCDCAAGEPDPMDPCSNVVVCVSPSSTLCRVNLEPEGSACNGTVPTTLCCGNGNVDPSEDCDEGGANSDAADATCRIDCTLGRCGDGITDPGRGEMCDDGNIVEGDGCTAACQVAPTYTPTFTATSTPTMTPTVTPTFTPSATPTPPPGIAGQVVYYAGATQPVPGVDVSLVGSAPDAQTTDVDGEFDFAGLAVDDWRIDANKLGGANGAVSALDAAHALQNEGGSRVFDAGQSLACDVDGDGDVDADDVSLILQRRVGLISTFPAATDCGSDWLFMSSAMGPAAITPDPSADPCERGGLGYIALAQRLVSEDLLAILIGDCTGNWAP